MSASSQTPTPSLASELPSTKANDSSIDQALTLLLADETEAALRWGAAALQRDPSTSSALVVTSRLLEKMGRTRAAIEGLHTAVRRALEAGNLPLAIAAIDELRALGENVTELFDQVSATFCDGSPRLDETPAPLSPHFDDFQPLSSYLAGPALASKAAQIVQAATERDGSDTAPSEALPPVARLPLFSALPKEALRDLLAAFDVITVPVGFSVMQEGDLGTTAYIVARGEIVLRRASGAKPPVVLARLGSGAFFGEMALLSDMPRAASAVATRPSILLVATREALDAVARRHPVVAVELAAHCHRRLVANLGRMAPILATLPPGDRAMVVEKFQTRIFRKGDRLATKGEEIGGLHLLASGAVAVVAYDGGERVVLATLSAGETVGEVELVLCRRANADAIALQPTVTLFLSREDFAALVLEHPALVHSLYVTAVRRDGETAQALESAAFTTNDYQLDDIVADEPPAAEGTRLDAAAFTETEVQPAATVEVATAAEAAAPTLPPPAVVSTPPALPSSPTAPEPSARVSSITAPFPPVPAAAPRTADLPVASARVTVPAPAAPPAPPLAPAATPEPPTVAANAPFSFAPPPLSARTALESLSARAALQSPQKPAAVPRFSTMSPMMAASRPPVPPASRARTSWELPPIAVIGAFAAVAVIGFALAAPLGNHLNTAAASGGGEVAPPNEVPAPAPERASQATPETAAIVSAPAAAPAPPASAAPPASVAPPAPVAAAAPPAPPAKVAAAPPAPQLRPVAPVHARPAPPPASEPAPASAMPTPAATASAAARPVPKATKTVPGSDEFGGRE